MSARVWMVTMLHHAIKGMDGDNVASCDQRYGWWQCCIMPARVWMVRMLHHAIKGMDGDNVVSCHQRYGWWQCCIMSARVHGQYWCRHLLVHDWARVWTELNSLVRWSNTCMQVNYTSIGSDNGLLHVHHQAIIWNNGGLLLEPWEQIQAKFGSKVNDFHLRNCFWKCHLQNGGHFIWASVC